MLQLLSAEGLCTYSLSVIQQSSLAGDISQKLRRQSMTEHQTYESKQIEYDSILSQLDLPKCKIVLIKGAALAQTVYSMPQMRYSADRDLVIHPNHAGAVTNAFFNLGFHLDYEHSARYHAGPTASIEQVLLQPHPSLTTCDALPLTNDEGLHFDVKVDPLEQGLQMSEFERFFDNCTKQSESSRLFIPDIVDQMLIACCHLHKDDFRGLRLQLDVFLLCRCFSAQDWNELLRRAKIESLELTIWVALNMVSDRFNFKLPNFVLEHTCPKNYIAAQLFLLQNYRFAWNQLSLLSLILNAVSSTNHTVKLKRLYSVVLPPKHFLEKYYCAEKRLPLMCCLVLHWFTLLVPDGIIRRTIGPFLWSQPLKADQSRNF